MAVVMPDKNWDPTVLHQQHRRPRGAALGEMTGEVIVRDPDHANYEREKRKDDERIGRLLTGGIVRR